MLEKLGDKTYVINSYNKIGVYLINKNDVIIIDTGINDEDGKLILDICKKENWNIKMILNTHSHIDHIGGNNYLQNKLGVKIYAKGIEKYIINYPLFLSTISYGGYPYKYLRNEFVIPKESVALELTKEILPKGITLIDLPGHNGDMVGFKTSDDIYFLADALAGKNIIKKYNIQFMYDVDEYFKTLNYIKTLKGKLFVPSHGDNFTNEEKEEIINLNKEAAENIIKTILELCNKKITYEEILKLIFEKYKLKMNYIQHAYIGATIRCYLSYLVDNNKLQVIIEDNVLYWKEM